VAMITTPRGNASQACRSAVRRICLDWMLVSETWNVMADREGQVGEVAIVGVAGVVEIDPPGVPGVVQARVSQREHRVDEGPGQKDGDQRETCQQVLGDSAGMTYPGQDYAHGDQAGARRCEQYRICQGAAGVLASGMGRCRVRIELPYGGPHPDAEDQREDVPANQRRRAARAGHRGGRASGHSGGQGYQQLRPRCRHPGNLRTVRRFRLHHFSLPACQPVARRRRAGAAPGTAAGDCCLADQVAHRW